MINIKKLITESDDKDKIIEYLKKELKYHRNNSHIPSHKYVADWLVIYIKAIKKM